jgi:hypothetical protein
LAVPAPGLGAGGGAAGSTLPAPALDPAEGPYDPTQPGPSPAQRVDLTVRLSAAERQELGTHLWHEIDQYRRDTEPRRGNVDQWRNDFELYPTAPSGRWPNSANMCAPLTHIYCQSHHVRLNQQIVQADPPFSVVAKTERALSAADAIQEALESILEEAAWDACADEVHSDLPVAGNGLVRCTWMVQYARCPRFRYDWDEAQFNAFTATGRSPTESFFDALNVDENGQPTVALEFENVLVKQGVELKFIPWEDSLCLPATARTPEDCYGLGERLMIRGSELMSGAKAGKYFKAEVDAVLDRGNEPQPQERNERSGHMGIAPDYAGNYMGQRDPLYKQHLCYELCWQMDTDDDGQMEWVIITLHWDTKRILRCQYLPYEHGQCYYTHFGYFIRPRELWSMSVAEKIAGIQDAASAVLNQLIDHGDLVLNLHGNWFYDGTADFNPAKTIIQMGVPIRVGNVDGVKLIDVGPIPQEHYNLYQLLKDMADLVTATSNPSLGKTTDTQKTLGEVQIVAGASNMIFEEHAARVARAWAKVWDQVRWLAAQFGDNGQVKYRKTARPSQRIANQDQPSQPQPMGPGYSFEVIDAELLMAEVDLIPAGLRQLSDMQSRLNQASIVQNTALVHPLLMQNLPALAIILDQFLQATGIPQRQKIMALVEQYVQGVEQAMQEQQMQGQNPVPPGAQDQGGGNNPGLQGAQGNNNRPATSPTPPPGPQDNLPPGRMSDATAQTVAGEGAPQ